MWHWTGHGRYILVRAATEVERGWAQALGDQFDPEETQAILGWLSDAVDLASRGMVPDRGHGATALGRFLLDRIVNAGNRGQ